MDVQYWMDVQAGVLYRGGGGGVGVVIIIVAPQVCKRAN